MHKKFIAGAMSALLLLNPLSAVAVSTTTSTQISGTSSAENASNVADESETSESTTNETTASTQTTETTSDEVQSSIEPSTASESTESSTIEAEKTASSSEETTDSSGVEATASTKVVGAFNPGEGKVIDSSNLDYFRQNIAKTYPLGIGTRFTAFAGDTIYFTNQYSGINFDGTYAANIMDITHDGVNYYKHSTDYPDSNSWNYPFSYLDTDGSQNPLVFVANTYQGSKVNQALTATNNFQDQQSFLFEGSPGPIDTLDYEIKSGVAENRTPVQGKVGDVVDFRENLGTLDANNLFSGETYFEESKKQLNTVSQYYKSFTETNAAVGNSSIDASIKAAVYGTADGWIDEIQVEVPLLKGSTTNGIALFNLSSKVLGSDKSRNALRIKLDNVYKDTPKDQLPFVIFNWNGWTESEWSDNNIRITFVDGDNNVLDKDSEFYKKMGTHIIHNFPDLTGELTLGQNNADFPFAGTVLVPNGSINLNRSNDQTQDAYWGSLIAGNNITLQLPISKEKAFGSVFDADNLPDLDDMSLKLSFTEDQVTVDNNQVDNNLNILGTGSNFTVSFTKEGASETDDPLKVHWDGDTDKKDDNKLSGINLKEDTPFTIDTTGWAPGTYKIIGRVTHWTDSKGNSVEKLEEDAPFAEFTLIVPKPAEILSLDEVPDLKFDDFTLGESGVGATSNLKDFTVTNAKTFDGNSTGALTISDSRNNNTGGNWSLEVSLTPFSLVGADETVNDIDAQLTLNVQQEKTAKNSSIVTSSEAGSESVFLLHKGGNEQSATENFRVLTDVDGELSSSLQLKKPATSLGTYHSTVTWTLGDLPRSDELTTNE